MINSEISETAMLKLFLVSLCLGLVLASYAVTAGDGQIPYLSSGQRSGS